MGVKPHTIGLMVNNVAIYIVSLFNEMSLHELATDFIDVMYSALLGYH